MTRRSILFLLAVLPACQTRTPPKRYSMQGEVKALDPAAKTATIAAGQIGDWMEPMTMEYPVEPDDDFARLHVGDRIQATVIVDDVKYYVTEVRVLSRQ